jgi:hypothetical protein
MMRSALLIFLFFSSCAALCAQDTIVMRDGTRLPALVKEVGQEEVRYKKAVNTDGPVYVMEKREIRRIIYADGLVERIHPFAPWSNVPDTTKINYYVWANALGFTIQKPSVSCEMQMRGGRFSVVASFTSGRHNNNSVLLRESRYYYLYNFSIAGIEARYYPTGQSPAAFFMGFSYSGGTVRYRERNNDIPVNSDPLKTAYRSLFTLNNGFIFYPHKRVCFSVSAGVALCKDKVETGELLFTQFPGAVNIGYRF